MVVRLEELLGRGQPFYVLSRAHCGKWHTLELRDPPRHDVIRLSELAIPLPALLRFQSPKSLIQSRSTVHTYTVVLYLTTKTLEDAGSGRRQPHRKPNQQL